MRNYNEQYIQYVDKFTAVKEPTKTPETYIYVLGESTSRDFMDISVKGLHNTPFMTASLHNDPNFVFHNDSYSVFSHTTQAVFHELTTATATQTNVANGKRTAIVKPPVTSLPQLANLVGFQTYWLSRQARYGIYDNLVTKLAEKNKHVTFIDDWSANKCGDDSALLPLLKNALQEDKSNNKLIFLHLMGCHIVYSDRYPNDYNQKIDKRVGVIGNLLHSNQHLARARGALNVNYLACIRYNDQIIKDIVTTAKTDPNFMGLLYAPDHGEFPVSPHSGHNYSSLEFSMVRVPVLFFVSDTYKERYPDKFEALQHNQHKLFSTDHLFDTFSDFIGIESNVVNKKMSLASSSYVEQNAEKMPMLLNRFVGEDPAFVVAKNGQDKRVILAKTNSMGKVGYASKRHISRMQFDLQLSKSFGVVVSPLTLSAQDVKLSEILDDYNSDLEYLVLRLHNITEANIDLFTELFAQLDAKYQLRDRVLLESDDLAVITRLQALGYRCSYIVSKKMTDKLLTILESGVTCISYDSELSQEVQNVLQKLGDNHSIQQIVNTQQSYVDQNLLTTLPKTTDDTMYLVRYKTPFDYE